MPKTKSPAFQFYANDFLSGTADMSNAEVGAYIRLLCHQWDKDELPNDVKILVRLCNGDMEGVEIAKDKFCENKNGKLVNKRLEKVRENQKNFSKKQSENGKKSAEKRWGKGLEACNGGYNLVMPPLQPKSNSSSSTSSSSSNIISKQQALEFLRRAAPVSIQEAQLQKEADNLVETYKGKRIGNLAALCNAWASKLKPETKLDQTNKNTYV